MRVRLFFAVALAASVPASAELVPVPDLGLRIAPGFEIIRYADSELAPDVYSMTLDPSGAVVISSRGYIKRLADNDGDGFADGGSVIIESGPGAMGMLFVDEQTLLTTEGGNFNRYSDLNGDGKFKPKPELIAKFGGGEHGVHAIRKDGSGRIYLIGGNGAKFRGHQSLKDNAPVEGGALLRYSTELKRPTVLCVGFRNPYDFDFNSSGQIYTYDSDCEREFFLPWYSPTRLYRVEDGAHHGWRLSGYQRGWKRPDYYSDSVRPLLNVGRGSPTGVAVYRHTAFPEIYHDAVFYCDWTFGRVYVTQTSGFPERVGFPSAHVFLESSGTNGFAPSDIEVAQDGSIFLSVGGRGTTGSVYHIRAKDPKPGASTIDLGEVVFRGWNERLEESGSGFNAQEAVAMVRHLDRTLLEATIDQRMKSMRLLMKALGDWNLANPSKESFTGYELSSDEVFKEDHTDLLVLARNSSRALLHSLDADERREAARLTAMLRDPHPIALTRMLEFFVPDSFPEEDFHYLACVSRLSLTLDANASKRLASVILSLDAKVQGKQMRSKQTYIDRLNEVIAGIADRGPIYDALCKDPLLARPNHVGIASAFPQPFRNRAAEQFFVASEKDPAAGWRADLVPLISGIDLTRAAPLLRRLAKDPSVRAACVMLLARRPVENDRVLFLAALSYPQKDVVSASLEALAMIGPLPNAEELMALFRVSDVHLSLPLIARLAGERFEDKSAAEQWLVTAHPGIARALNIDNATPAVDWTALFATIDWSSGNPERGRKIFAGRACIACHVSANALGPDLAGVWRRLSPADLFKAIVTPDADVPPAYRATIFTLRDGSKHVGRVAFNSADGVIVRTGPGSTVRLNEADILGQEDWSRSLMPEGLLVGLGTAQLADLYAYIKTL